MKKFFDALPKGKEVRVETKEFTYSDERKVTRQLLAKAMADARSTADEVASSLGKTIIGVHNVSETPQSGNYFRGWNNTNVEGVTVVGNGAIGVPRANKLVLKEGVVQLSRTVYIIYLLSP